MQRSDNRLPPDRISVAAKIVLFNGNVIAEFGGDANQPDRFIRGAAAGTGDAGNRDAGIGIKFQASALHHRPHALTTDRAVAD